MLKQQPKAWREKVAGLNCALVQGDDAAPRTVVVLCHGFGAPGDDLVSLSLELMHQGNTLSLGVQFVFPEAPLTLASMGLADGRAWWMIDMERLLAAQRGDMAKAQRTRTEKPAGLESARKNVQDLVAELSTRLKLPLSRFVLGGFSQGAMVMTDLTLRLPQNPAGLAIMSGTMINEPEWQQLVTSRKGLRVVQSHGRQDALLSFAFAEGLRDLLQSGGCDVQFVPFDGGHTITVETLHALVQLIEAAHS